MVRVYHTPHQKTANHQNNHENSREPPTMNWSQYTPGSDERLLARAHHAPLYGRSRKTRLGVIEMGDDDEHPGGTCDMQILMGNHRSGFKNNLPVNLAKILSVHWVAVGTLSKSTQ
jgi:hypothetical protein